MRRRLSGVWMVTITVYQRASPLFRRLRPCAVDDNARQVDAGVALDQLSDPFLLEANAAV